MLDSSTGRADTTDAQTPLQAALAELQRLEQLVAAYQTSSEKADAHVKQLQVELAQRAALHDADVRALERQLQQAQLHASRGGGPGLAEHLRQRLALEGALQAATDAAAEAEAQHKVRGVARLSVRVCVYTSTIYKQVCMVVA